MPASSPADAERDVSFPPPEQATTKVHAAVESDLPERIMRFLVGGSEQLGRPKYTHRTQRGRKPSHAAGRRATVFPPGAEPLEVR